MRLSIIIPMYNCAPVIERCLDSIDVFPEMEVIVVDDGSTDNGSAVVQQYAENHPYVRLLQKDNGGVSSARNLGIESASGNYIMFVDADDYLKKGGLERVLALAEEQDADVLKYKIIGVCDEFLAPNQKVDCASMDYRLILGQGKALAGTSVSDYHVVDGLFRREILMTNQIRFHEDLYLHEDDVFMAELYVGSSRVVATDLALYCYIVASQYSHTHNPTKERARMIIDSALHAVRYRCLAIAQLQDPKINDLERFKHMRFVYSCVRLMMLSNYSYDEYKEMLDRFRPYGCYPLEYKWLKVCLSVTPKLLFKTFLCNHPRIAWFAYKPLILK